LVEQVLAAYPKDVKFVYKQFPLTTIHKDAKNAAKASLAAHRQGKFWQMHDELFKNQRELGYDKLKEYAKTAGLDVARFEKDMAAPEVEAEVSADVAEGTKAQVTGTPTFFVNGKRLMTRTVEGFKAVIDEALKAKKG
jgi:protein-disulfide isomerase